MHNKEKLNMSHQRLKSTRKNKGSTFVGIFLGLLIGLLIALALFWYFNKSKTPFVDRTGERVETAPQTAKATPDELPAIVSKEVAGAPASSPIAAPVAAPAPATSVAAAQDKPRFEFYKILPGGDGAPVPTTSAVSTKTVLGKAESRYLQVGAFNKTTDADNLKAKLALTGYEASVQQVNVPDKGVFYRVRVGPFTSDAAIKKAQAELTLSGLPTSVVKAK
jgi:cell division protein FtsN